MHSQAYTPLHSQAYNPSHSLPYTPLHSQAAIRDLSDLLLLWTQVSILFSTLLRIFFSVFSIPFNILSKIYCYMPVPKRGLSSYGLSKPMENSVKTTKANSIEAVNDAIVQKPLHISKPAADISEKPKQAKPSHSFMCLRARALWPNWLLCTMYT